MEIFEYSVLPRNVLDGVQVVHQEVFGDFFNEDKLQRKNLLAFVAIVDEQVAGFKFGYELEDGVFYSWLGGVHPRFQRRGIAKQLMERQHAIAQARGYQIIRTYSRNEKMGMLILNLQSGFHVISTFTDEKGWHKIELEKQL